MRRPVDVNARAQVLRPGERTNSSGKPVGSRVLLSIPDAEFRAIRPYLEFYVLVHHRVLHEPSQKLEFAYFPNSGLVSLVVATEDGKTVEAGVVGNEGMTGVPSAVGLRRNPLREVVQVSGDSFRIKVRDLQAILPTAPQLRMILSRYAVLQWMQIAQTAACNRLHEVQQRLARWLLMAQDRVDSASLPITHDFLATMLGTDRPSVSLAAAMLQRRNIIAYTRGSIKILNRKKLEGFACECYGIIQQLNGELGLK